MKTVRNILCAAFIVAALCIILRGPDKASSPTVTTASVEQKNVVATAQPNSERVTVTYSLDTAVKP